MSVLDDGSDSLARANAPERYRTTSGGRDKRAVASQGNALGTDSAVNASFRERGPGGHVKTVDDAVAR